jgi:hypothetical protein
VERQRGQEWRGDCHGMNGGAEVVRETRERQFRGTHAAANSIGGLEDEHGSSGARQNSRRGQTVRPGTDYNPIVFAAARHNSPSYDGQANYCEAEILDQRRT